MNYFVMDTNGDEHQLAVSDDVTDEDLMDHVGMHIPKGFVPLRMYGGGEVRYFRIDSIAWFGRRTQSEKFLMELENSF